MVNRIMKLSRIKKNMKGSKIVLERNSPRKRKLPKQKTVKKIING